MNKAPSLPDTEEENKLFPLTPRETRRMAGTGKDDVHHFSSYATCLATPHISIRIRIHTSPQTTSQLPMIPSPSTQASKIPIYSLFSNFFRKLPTFLSTLPAASSSLPPGFCFPPVPLAALAALPTLPVCPLPTAGLFLCLCLASSSDGR